MDKLRVGGPCVTESYPGRWVVTALRQRPNGAVECEVADGKSIYHFMFDHQATPAPFIPGDVVEHSLHPEYGRGLVFHAADLGDGDASVYVRWQGIEHRENAYYAQPSSPSEDAALLTLILPAQPAKEARDAR